ncbi:PREDICTED: uncharacterized protein LOC109243064 [Nicotiana attenuata]|uniref:E3 ubiquitin-protein ligase RMA n=1 Tax=Nicotiana attenuata TaxID=49451 RepID=A0A314L2G9_NICAT|nr:PREDICTED: uncharacterized protein LOC109243064 [Nicotiana attenuata]XP_019265503.1 PREDICTED: uncharacterized protein LOC109243064 [Nicotiana attenuata]OIT35672.1 e3 ubiquitin-protein ligase rma1h1 [Nicotiana attenuata]
MADNLMNGVVMDLDLNQEPTESSSGTALGLGSLLNDLETANSRIEQRILQLAAVAAGTWQHHRWRSQTRNSSSDDIGNNNVDNEKQEKGCKRDRSHLVAKALEMDLVVKKVGKDGGSGSFFDCNICLDMAKEPILTCCGHLYCWSCFYQLPYVDSSTKECPVCKGEVIDENITPIYGNGHSYCSKELVECGFKIPPRPKAHRVESVRQQRVTRGLSHIPVAEALRRIRTSIGLGDHPSQQLATGDVSSSSLSSSHELQNADPIGSRGLRSRVFPRVLSEGAASLSSELENAQQMFEDLAASLTDRIRERNNSQVLPISHVAADEDNSLRRDAAIIRSERQTLDSIVETSSATSSVPSSQSNEVSDAALQLENLTTDAGNLPVSRSSLFSRRRSGFSRLSDLDSGLLRETRRRRLN